MNPYGPDAVSDETAAFNARLAQELAAMPQVHTIPPELTRKARAEGRGIFPAAGPLAGSHWQEIEGAPGGPGRVRISPAEGTACGTYLHIHGGGWTLGSPEQSDGHNQRIASAAGAEVVSAAYRLSPEHRWPGCLQDCVAAARWVLATRPGPLVIGGESAGAHLAALVALALGDAGAAGRLAGLVLNYGIYDLAMTPSMRNWGARYLILSTPVTEWFVANLVGDDAAARVAASPLGADLGGLPPALFQVGTCDPLLDDSLFMAARWRAAGGNAELAIYPGGVHAFDMFDLEIARRSTAHQDRFIRACFTGFRE